MEGLYKKINNLTGWVVWLIATLVYIATIEPTASFWDCGEFIAAAFKLQVGHPPGAPLWLIIGRVFGLFAADVEGVAAMINVFSAMCSSFSILFLFWSITAIAKKMVGSDKLNSSNLIAIMTSGAVGALVYTFSDSFWFSAVEAEVYAASSLFTAAVFWLILKWEANADEPYADRYLLLLAYLMGLSIGVHILNLLAIPAIVYVYYFKKYKYSLKGLIWAGVISVGILGVVQKGIISYSVAIAAKFEVYIVNNFGLPFNSGMWIYFLLITGLIVWGLLKSKKAKNALLHNSIIALLLILIGYTSFAMIVVRSAANPPMDENNPDNIVSLLPYLNREQYGDSPLLYGQTFAGELDADEPYLDGTPVYYRASNGKYEIADKRKESIPNYDKKTSMYFSRMFSQQEHHIRAYKTWSDFKGKRVSVKVRGQGGRLEKKIVYVPTMGENLQYFFRYQLNYSYWRYFMWNFTGRQNDIQGHGAAQGGDAVLKGNWLSGVPFVDNAHLGDQSSLPVSLKDNPGRNVFYMFPLILGLLGLIYNFAKNWQSGFVVALLFFMTGIAIILYLNPTPYQPRERDYAYSCSFYAYAIWVGLGVLAIFKYMFNEKIDEDKKVVTNSVLVTKLSAIGKYEVLLFTAGLLAIGLIAQLTDNEVVANGMFYVAFVIAVLVGFAYLLGSLKISANIKAIIAMLLTLPVPYLMAVEGWDDHNRSDKYTARDFARNYLDSCAPNAILFTNGDNDTFPLWYVQDVEGYRTDVRVVNLSLLNTDWYIDQMVRKAYESDPVPISFTQDQYRQGTRDYVLVGNSSFPMNINEAMNFVKSEEASKKLLMMNGSRLNQIPSRKLVVPVDTADLKKRGIVTSKDKSKLVNQLEISITGNTVMKSSLMILDMIAKNNWERPIYFAITVGNDYYLNLEDYFELEGLAYRLTPVKHGSTQGESGGMNIEKMYDNFMNKYQWGNMEKPGVYLEEQTQRMCMNFRNNFARLAKTMARELGDKKRALLLLDRCIEIMPKEKVPYNYFTISIADAYYSAGNKEKGDEILMDIAQQFYDEMIWMLNQSKHLDLLSGEIERARKTIETTAYFATVSDRKDLAKKIKAFLPNNGEGLGF